MRKSIKALAVSGAAAAALAVAAGTASAAVNPNFSYTTKGAAAVAGYFAHGTNPNLRFSHITAYAGNDGQANQEQLAVTDVTSGNVAGDLLTISNAVGVGLCNQSGGAAAQLGETYIGNGLVDVVYATGHITGSANGDHCQGGIIGTQAKILMANVPVNNTVSLDILYDGSHAYTFRGHRHAAGDVTFSATDLHAAPGVAVQASTHSPGIIFNEGDAGTIADAQTVTPLPGTLPYADVFRSPNLLATFAHVSLNGNVVGGSEVMGSIQNTSAWNAFGVAATKNGGAPTAGNPVYLGFTPFKSDHFKLYIGSPVSS